MSSIAHPYEKQIRHLIIAETVSNAATFDAFAQAAVPLSIAAYSENGVAVEAGKPFYFAYTNKQGVVRRSDIIRPETIEYEKATEPRDKVGKKEEFTISAVTVGKPYTLTLKVHYNTMVAQYHTFVASTRAEDGDTATTVAKRLANQMATQLSKDVRTLTHIPGADNVDGIKNNKYFKITQTAGKITIEENDWVLDGFAVALREMDQLLWNAEVASDFFEKSNQVTKVVTAGQTAVNPGYEVAAAEHYLQMHRQSFYSSDIENSIREELVADKTASYNTFDLSYFAESLYDPQKSDKMLTIASTEADVVELAMTAVAAAKGEADDTPDAT